MPKTFEEANEDVGERRKEARERLEGVEEELSEYDLEDLDLRARDFGKLFEAFGDDVQVVQERREEAADEFERTIKIDLEEQLGIDFGDIDDVIGEFPEIDLDQLDQQGLLAVIAEQMNAAAAQLAAMTSQNSGLAALLDDIASSVQAPFGIAVSGVNDITDPGVPQPVVTGSDGGDIDARVFKLKASEENKYPIWIGSENVDVGSGTKLRPGEDYPVELDLTQDQLYMVSEEEAQEIEIIGFA